MKPVSSDSVVTGFHSANINHSSHLLQLCLHRSPVAGCPFTCRNTDQVKIGSSNKQKLQQKTALEFQNNTILWKP